MLTNPRRTPTRIGPTLILLAAVGVLAFLLGDRHGRRASLGPAAAAKPSSAASEVAAAPPEPLDGGAGADAGVLAGALPRAPSAIDAGSAPETHALALTLNGSLDETVEAAVTNGEGPALTMVISRLLVWFFNPSRDARPGDKLWVVYRTPAGEEPLVLGLRYQSQKLGAIKTAIRFQPAGATFAHYYDESGNEIEERLVDSPVDDYDQITSLLRDGRGHKGVDFRCPVGSAVKSPVDGVVRRRNWKVRVNGDCLGIEDRATHRELLFLHLSEISAEVKVGSIVKKGQVIAKSGNTGHTTAPHLHYQLMSPDDRVLDPFSVQPTLRRKLEASELPSLQRAVGALPLGAG